MEAQAAKFSSNRYDACRWLWFPGSDFGVVPVDPHLFWMRVVHDGRSLSAVKSAVFFAPSGSARPGSATWARVNRVLGANGRRFTEPARAHNCGRIYAEQ